MKTEILIRIEDGCISVWKDGKTSGQLSWDEMLGQVAELTHHDVKAPHYPMMTPEEWDAWRDKVLYKHTETE